MDPAHSHSLIPVYREGLSNPWHPNDWFDRFAMDPMGFGFGGGPSSWRHPQQAIGGGTDMMREMNRMMEPLFPFARPSQVPGSSSGGDQQTQISWQPSALSPRYDSKTGAYSVEIQAQDFAPNEVTVKTVSRHGHQFLVAEGKHETVDGAGYHSVHHFKRQYMLPDTVDPHTLKAKLDNKGMMTITAPVQKSIKDKERSVPMESVAAPVTKK